uniref:Cyclin N-terminal domain-containing protein n=1 Tax=Arion vulgaris TaxID=1028688 RepID=A0A0B7A0X6_9EUPU
MFAHKKLPENVDPCSQVVGPKPKKKGVTDGPGKGIQAKLRKPEVKLRKPAPAIGQVKRPAFGDITNATQEQSLEIIQKRNVGPVKPNTRSNILVPFNKTSKTLAKKKTLKETNSLTNIIQNSSISSNTSSSSISDQSSSSQKSTCSSTEETQKILADRSSADRIEEDISFITTDESSVETGTASNISIDVVEEEKSVPSVDLENYKDVFNVGIYAQHIFDYYKRREKIFQIPAYMNSKQNRITPMMRAILVDWMVEIQENFELNHETLYLAVKLTDMYLSRVPADKEFSS